MDRDLRQVSSHLVMFKYEYVIFSCTVLPLQMVHSVSVLTLTTTRTGVYEQSMKHTIYCTANSSTTSSATMI